MDYFQGVVTEFLRAKRSQFVNTEYMINLDLDGIYLKGRHWYCDVVAIDFAEHTVHLCEVTYSKTLQAIIARLQAWSQEWPSVVSSIHRDSALTGEWAIAPRVFIPQELEPLLQSKLANISRPDDSSLHMPEPIVTALETVLPWRYRSWNGKAFVM